MRGPGVRLFLPLVPLLAACPESYDPFNPYMYLEPDRELLLDVAADQSYLLYASEWSTSETGVDGYALHARSPEFLDARLSPFTYSTLIVGSTAVWSYAVPQAWWPGLTAPIRMTSPSAWAYGAVAHWNGGSIFFADRARCSSGVCRPTVLAEGVEDPALHLSLDGRWLLFATITAQTASVSIVNTETGAVRLIEEREGEWLLGDLGTFAPEGSSIVFESRLDEHPRIRAYDAATGVRTDWPELPVGWILDRAFIDSNRMSLIFEPRDEPGYRIVSIDERSFREAARIAGTSSVRLLAGGKLVLEIGGDVSDLRQARVYDLRTEGAQPVALGRFEDLVDVAPDGSRIAFFDKAVPDDPTLVVVSIPDGARDVISGVAVSRPGGLYYDPTAALLASDAIVYLDQIDASAAGTLHVRRSGEDRIVATGVANFRVASDPARVYFTQVPPGVADASLGGRIDSVLISSLFE